MEDHCRLDEQRVSEFLWTTCNPRPALNTRTIDALGAAVTLKLRTTKRGSQYSAIPTITGSVSEFYIDPMLSTIGDIDVMFYYGDVVAVPEGSAVPRHLPAEFDDTVTVLEVRGTGQPNLPCYVYLLHRHELKAVDSITSTSEDDIDLRVYQCKGCVESGVDHDVTELVMSGDVHGYGVKRSNVGQCISNRMMEGSMSGPANAGNFSIPNNSPTKYFGSAVETDFVYCVRCLAWPLQAADWPRRPRSNGWPDEATIERVVGNGCDVVPVAHRTSSDDCEWRLSFSRAEVALLNSWTPEQQIVYHTLRYVAKSTGLTDIANTSGHKIISGYQLKTLMLWTCELKPSTWWADHRKLVNICRCCLRTLRAWLRDAQCLHYFVAKHNFWDQTDRSKELLHLLEKVEVNLSQFIHDKYIRRCAALSQKVQLFRHITTERQLLDAVSAVESWRIQNIRESSQANLKEIALSICEITNKLIANDRLYVYFLNELANIKKELLDYFYGTLFLLNAVKMKYVEANQFDNLVEILYAALHYMDGIKSVDSHKPDEHLEDSKYYALKATNMMRSLDRECCSLLGLRAETAQFYFKRVLSSEDSGSESLRCLSHVYLAALHYATGQYQTATDHCNAVTAADDHSQCTSHVVERSLLLPVDDDVDNVLGLVVFYEYLAAVARNGRQTSKHPAIFTTELFACYLHAISLHRQPNHRAAQLSKLLQRYRSMLLNETLHPFVTDLLLFHICAEKFRCSRCDTRLMSCSEDDSADAGSAIVTTRTDGLTHQNLSAFSVLLQRAAIDRFRSFRHFEVEQIGCQIDAIADEYLEAFYAFCRGDYQRCSSVIEKSLTVRGYTELFTAEPESILFPDHLAVQLCDFSMPYSLMLLYFRSPTHIGSPAGDWVRGSMLLCMRAESMMRCGERGVASFTTLRLILRAKELLDSCFVLNHLMLAFVYRKLERYLRDIKQRTSRIRP